MLSFVCRRLCNSIVLDSRHQLSSGSNKKKIIKKLFFSCDVLFIFLSALLSHVSALLIGVLDSGHQLSSVPSGSNSKNLKEVYLFEISFVELLSINEGTIIVIKSSFTTFLDNILLFIYPRNVCKSILFN